ncbi:MAG: LytTR family transcriptional regulator DNA-binding domain-containing protein, partial [Bacteroidetes bacterium]|nr:LytTR family transcriptional regulator DNA-binding domain-containing protein [Bacteroidota bacterium]
FSLEELTNRLDPVKFFKISRQFMVSHPSINNIHPFFNNRLKLELVPEIPKDVFVSRSNVREFKQWLDT